MSVAVGRRQFQGNFYTGRDGDVRSDRPLTAEDKETSFFKELKSLLRIVNHRPKIVSFMEAAKPWSLACYTMTTRKRFTLTLRLLYRGEVELENW